jgi:hypothetical protein
VGGAGQVDPQQDVDPLGAIGWDLLQRRLGDSDLIGGGVGAGVPGRSIAAAASEVLSK